MKSVKRSAKLYTPPLKQLKVVTIKSMMNFFLHLMLQVFKRVGSYLNISSFVLARGAKKCLLIMLATST